MLSSALLSWTNTKTNIFLTNHQSICPGENLQFNWIFFSFSFNFWWYMTWSYTFYTYCLLTTLRRWFYVTNGIGPTIVTNWTLNPTTLPIKLQILLCTFQFSSNYKSYKVMELFSVFFMLLWHQHIEKHHHIIYLGNFFNMEN